MHSIETTQSQAAETPLPEQRPLFVEPAVPPSVTYQEILQQKAEMKELGNKRWRAAEFKHLNAWRKVENTYIVDTHPYASFHEGDATVESFIHAGRAAVRHSLETAHETKDVHNIVGMGEEKLATTLRAVEWYGTDIAHHFDIEEAAVDLSIGQLRAVAAMKHNLHPAIHDFVSLSLPEVAELQEATLEQRQAAMRQRGEDSTLVQPLDFVKVWHEIRAEQSVEVSSEYVDSMTLMLAMWSLSAMSVRGPEDADREAAEETLQELQEAVAQQPVVVQPELQSSEFVDILPTSLGQLAIR